MALLASTLRVAPAAMALAALVSACDKPKPRPAQATPVAAVATAAPAAPPTTNDALPAQPEWATAYMGKVLATVFPDQNGRCLGNTDVVNLYYRGSSEGLRVEGWGWASDAKAPVARVLLVDEGGQIVGAGESGKSRPDVTAARKEVTSPNTGWEAVTAKSAGAVDAFGLMPDGKSVCRLGHLSL